MNTDHINYQQKIAQSEKDFELLSKNENAPKQQISSNSTELNQASIATNGESQRVDQLSENSMNNLTSIERRERTLTLFVIGFIALLTGTIVFIIFIWEFYFYATFLLFFTGIDYAIILPTAWGYIKTFMQYHYGGFVMGILLSVFALSGAIAGIILGYLNDIGVSLKRLVLFGIMFKIVGNLLYFIGINIYIVILSRLIAGIGMGLVVRILS